jgi:hypothetical protein
MSVNPTDGVGCTLPSIPRTNLLPNGPLLCKEECDIASSGLAKIIREPGLCKNITALQSQMATCDAFYAASLKQNGACLFAVESDINFCGKRRLCSVMLSNVEV